MEGALKSSVGSLDSWLEKPKTTWIRDSGDEVEVEAILDKQLTNGTPVYLVKWRGFSEKHNSWQPRNTLNCDLMLEAFEASIGQKAKEPSSNNTKRRSSGGLSHRKKIKGEPAKDVEQWEVERILKKRDTPQGPLYLTKWKGWAMNESTWEPRTSFSSSTLIDAFEYTQKFLLVQKAADAQLASDPMSADFF